MKNFLPILFVSLLSTSLFSQSKIGKLFVGGQINVSGYNNQDTEILRGNNEEYEYTYFSLSVNPRAGRFINENTAIGLGVNYQFYYSGSQLVVNNSANGRGFSHSYHILSLNPHLTKFYPLIDKLYLTTDLNLSAGAGRSDLGGNSYNLITFGIRFTPGISYFMNDKWLLNVGLGDAHYDWTRETLAEGVSDEGRRIRHNYGVRFRLSRLYLGLQYFIN